MFNGKLKGILSQMELASIINLSKVIRKAVPNENIAVSDPN